MNGVCRIATHPPTFPSHPSISSAFSLNIYSCHLRFPLRSFLISSRSLDTPFNSMHPFLNFESLPTLNGALVSFILSAYSSNNNALFVTPHFNLLSFDQIYFADYYRFIIIGQMPVYFAGIMQNMIKVV